MVARVGELEVEEPGNEAGWFMECSAFINAMAQPVLVLDGSFRFVMANPAFFHLFLIPEYLHAATPFSGLKFLEPGQVEMLTALEAALEISDPNEVVEFTCIVPPGMYRSISVHACRVVVEENAPEIIIAEFQDITRSKGEALRVQELNETVIRHAQELKKSNESLELFSHAVSHDLRAPLRLMNMLAHTLQSECLDQLPGNTTEKLTKLVDTTEEMGALIQDLLALAHPNRTRLSRKKVNLYEIAKASLELFKDEQEERNLQVTLENLPPCAGDQNLIKQVYTNLLANAFKFTRTRAQAEIQIGCENADGRTVYFVRDNCIGFGTSSPEAIFQPFFRLPNARSCEGSGIGLALVKRIIEYHGGRVWADGCDKQATTIYFTLSDFGSDGNGFDRPESIARLPEQSLNSGIHPVGERHEPSECSISTGDPKSS